MGKPYQHIDYLLLIMNMVEFLYIEYIWSVFFIYTLALFHIDNNSKLDGCLRYL